MRTSLASKGAQSSDAAMAAQIPALFETLSGMKMAELFAKIKTIGDKKE